MFLADGIADRVSSLVASLPCGLYIGGHWRSARDDRTLPVEDPATGRVVAHVADASAADALDALDAAAAAQEDWARTAPRRRAEILWAGFHGIQARRDDFALLMTVEMGKPLAEALGEVDYGSEFLRWAAEQAAHVSGRYNPAPDGAGRILVAKRPVGPCYLVTPWNFPLAMAARKAAPALAAGCTVVVKPAQLTPLTTLLFAQTMAEAGLPAGVLNVITASSASRVTAPLLADPRLRKLSFTGSTAVGQGLLKGAADSVLRVSMELGGNAPFLVFEDADLDEAVAGAVAAKLRNGGEACTAANRFYVQSALAGEFARRLAAALSQVKVGPGWDPGVGCGPLIDQAAVERVGALVEDAVARGAEVLTGGSALPGPGHFFAPTVLRGVPRDAPLVQGEIFGPVAPVMEFHSEDEAVELANSTPYGLIAYAFTNDLRRALRLPERIEAGMVALNSGVISNPAAPFGGVKRSGLGREGGAEGIEEYLETQYIGIADPWG
ncbi:MAG: NAD-dependent succinate-semialdehyde dehydrogenase [Propionibacteriaceae bacterium]|jgi:succinate-semialdehyde dehydrogenase/glutarate-semialdehyde dehydrogenase|nr:NAD-dependent succinate-semialdehyde dehydrogenase [Propionibacteriaceae bacterium]